METLSKFNSTKNISSERTITKTSLLRYPGGKTRAVEAITSLFPEDLKEMCSPFFGGGSIEIYMACKGVKVYGYDVFKPLVEFWQCVNTSPAILANKVQHYYPLSKEEFYELQKKQNKLKSKTDRAAAYYVLNRSSFSGSTLSGGMSPDHPRFTPSSVDRIRQFYNPNFQVEKMSFQDSIRLHKKKFLYLDPPYLINGALYGKNGNTHKGFDHEGLAETLKKRGNWILSYNDCDEIRKMYSGFEIQTPAWKYGMSGDKSSKEVLIFSRDIRMERG